MLHMILMIFAFVLFVLAGVGIYPQPTPPGSRYNLISLGLACWVLSVILIGVVK